MTGQTSCGACSTCDTDEFTSTACTASSDAVCTACDASCLTCNGSGPGQCTSCVSTQKLVGGECQSLCGIAPDPLCLVAGKAQLQANEKKAGKEKLQLQWKKIAGPTDRAGFGNPVSGNTVVVMCIFNDAGALVGERIVDRGLQNCGTKPCWKLTGKQGFQYADKTASAAGIAKIIFGGGAATKGKAAAQGKNGKNMNSLPLGLAAALSGNATPTIQMVTNAGFCVGAKMTKVTKDAPALYKAKK